MTYVYTYIHVDLNSSIHGFVQVHGIHRYTNTCIYKHTYIYIYIYIYVYFIYVYYIYIYICMYMYTRTYMYI